MPAPVMELGTFRLDLAYYINSIMEYDHLLLDGIEIEET
jgi:hypothetical protein